MRTVTVLTACLNRSCPSKIGHQFPLEGVSGAVSKTLTAPIERVKLVIQTQNANPKLRNEGAALYRHRELFLSHLQRAGRRGLLASQLHELHPIFSNSSLQFVLQGFDQKMFPKYKSKQDFGMIFAVNMASGALAAAGSLTIVYLLDYARTRLASDVGSGKKTFDGLFDWFKKAAAGPKGFFSLHAGFGVSLGGIIPYRGFQLGAFDTIVGASTRGKTTPA